MAPGPIQSACAPGHSAILSLPITCNLDAAGADGKPKEEALLMTDHPRFERVEGPVETLHDRYHGGGLVAFVFRLADLWVLRRPLPWASLPWRTPDADSPALGVRRARRRVLLTGVIMLAVVLAVTLWLPGKRDGAPQSLPRQPDKLAFCPA
jgi:hypothetical protein